MTIRATISIVPFGDENKERIIQIFNISNTGAHANGAYKYVIEVDGYKSGKGDLPSVWHYREDGAAYLVQKAINKCMELSSTQKGTL